jgi:hypothetical protein
MTGASESISQKVRLCSQALAKLNGPTIESFDDKSRESMMCSILYEETYLKALSTGRWSFSLSYALLSPDASYHPPPGGAVWAYRFPVPSDCINVLGIRAPDGGVDTTISPGTYVYQSKLNGYSVGYELRDNAIFSNNNPVIVDYQYRVPETQLHAAPLFRDYLINLLASELAIPLMNDVQKAQYFSAKAENAYYLASSVDTNQSPSEAADSSMTLVRMRTFG